MYLLNVPQKYYSNRTILYKTNPYLDLKITFTKLTIESEEILCDLSQVMEFHVRSTQNTRMLVM